MDGRYQLIDEVSLSVLGTFKTQKEAVDSVAELLSVNDDDFLDELTIANDDGPLLYGESLRDALRDREAVRSGALDVTRNGSHAGRPVGALADKRDFRSE
jgi:hypothetical protein